MKKRVERHSKREKNKAKDFVQKLTIAVIKLFPKITHGFEDLNNWECSTNQESITKKSVNKTVRK